MQTFLATYVDSHDDLAVLLVLAEEGGAPLGVTEIASRSRVSFGAARDSTTVLRGRGLVVGEAEGPDGLYRYAPRDESLAACVRLLATVYEENLPAVVRQLTNQSIARVRSQAIDRFADSFIVDRGRRDGAR